MPIQGSRRHVLTGKVVVLMARTAFHCVGSVPVWTAANAHRVRMTVVALSGKVPAGVAIHAARVTQDGNDGFKGGGRHLTITRRILKHCNFFAASALRNFGTRNHEEFVEIR